MPKLFLKHDTTSGVQLAEAIMAGDLVQPATASFTNQTSVSVNHNFGRVVRFVILTATYHKFPETRISDVLYNMDTLVVSFNDSFSGTIYVYP
jgi:hypothetical protein